MLIRRLPMSVLSGDITYAVHVCGEQRPDGTWLGWIEFHPRGLKPTLLTNQETSQCFHVRSSDLVLKKRSMMAAVCSHSRASAWSCLRPAAVSL